MTSIRKPRPLLRRYAPDLAVLMGTAAFLVITSVLGLWLVHSG
ncbi:MAG TPA: hypothetical protein VE442_26350 [Jatrophihabitans sp.]|jgi:uncharacterized membrane protein|nr:hypothetical protein [Jatrophihabitans sp.]